MIWSTIWMNYVKVAWRHTLEWFRDSREIMINPIVSYLLFNLDHSVSCTTRASMCFCMSENLVIGVINCPPKRSVWRRSVAEFSLNKYLRTWGGGGAILVSSELVCCQNSASQTPSTVFKLSKWNLLHKWNTVFYSIIEVLGNNLLVRICWNWNHKSSAGNHVLILSHCLYLQVFSW